MADHDTLLQRFAPQLRYDSNEQYFADSAAQWTDCPGNELRRAPGKDGSDGKVIARATPTGGEPQLTLAFLGSDPYPGGRPHEAGDVIGDPSTDYRKQYVALRSARPDLRNRIYGHAVEQDGRIWLQYWFWYFYNDYRLALDLGLHEGDWEMVMLRMHPTEEHPDVAVYAQHRYGEKRRWENVEKVGEQPVVYVARGSHASYFERGFHRTEVWYDIADGRRPAPPLTLDIFRPETHGWMLWKGRWGDTTPRNALQDDSPTGPGAKKQWTHPTAMLDSAVEGTTADGPGKPDVVAVRDAGRLRIDYDLSGRDPRPGALVVTVNSRDDKGVPPQTHTFTRLDATGRGSLATGIALDPAKHYDLYVSTIAGDPPLPSESEFVEIDPVRKRQAESLLTRLTGWLSRIVAWIRGDR